MLIAILFWLAVVALGYFYISKWHKYEAGEEYLKVWHYVFLGVAALGTFFLIIKVIFGK